jgi:hypothetical protein
MGSAAAGSFAPCSGAMPIMKQSQAVAAIVRLPGKLTLGSRGQSPRSGCKSQGRQSKGAFVAGPRFEPRSVWSLPSLTGEVHAHEVGLVGARRNCYICPPAQPGGRRSRLVARPSVSAGCRHFSLTHPRQEGRKVVLQLRALLPDSSAPLALRQRRWLPTISLVERPKICRNQSCCFAILISFIELRGLNKTPTVWGRAGFRRDAAC